MQRQRLIWFWIQTKIICRDLPAEPPDEFYLYESEGWRRDGGDGWEGGVGRKRVARRGIRPVRKPEACAMSFSLAAEPTKLIFNFLSLIRHGSSYGPLGLYATALVVLLPWWPSVHDAPLFRGCIILPLETRYFLPYPFLLTLDCANEPRTARVVHGHRRPSERANMAN